MTDPTNDPAVDSELPVFVDDGTMIDASKPEHVHEFSAESGQCSCGETMLGLVLSDPSVMRSVAPEIEAVSYADAFQRGKSVGNTPNVVIDDPAKRKLINTVVAFAGIALSCATVADVASPGFDIAFITEPAWAVYGVIQGAFGLAVINSNIPKRRA